MFEGNGKKALSSQRSFHWATALDLVWHNLMTHAIRRFCSLAPRLGALADLRPASCSACKLLQNVRFCSTRAGEQTTGPLAGIRVKPVCRQRRASFVICVLILTTLSRDMCLYQSLASKLLGNTVKQDAQLKTRLARLLVAIPSRSSAAARCWILDKS